LCQFLAGKFGIIGKLQEYLTLFTIKKIICTESLNVASCGKPAILLLLRGFPTIDAEDYYHPHDLLHRAYCERVRCKNTQMTLEANIFDIARLERALIAIDRKVSQILKLLKECEEEDADYP
jgi:hypothetical protein